MTDTPVLKPDKCAICSRPATEKFKPFCSPRCATLDLGRWLGEGYSVPAVEDDPEDGFAIPDHDEDD
jgi:endogenous inhibitor of DNA gyrase (YacG/DUF329 family)